MLPLLGTEHPKRSQNWRGSVGLAVTACFYPLLLVVHGVVTAPRGVVAWPPQPDKAHVPSKVSFAKYAAPESRFCPAGVYEYPEGWGVDDGLVITGWVTGAW